MFKMNYLEMIREYFDFLFDDYGYLLNKYIEREPEYGVYYLKSSTANLKIMKDRFMCGILFWPVSDVEEHALPISWLYEYHESKGELPKNDDILPIPIEVFQAERCFKERRQMLISMKDLLFSENLDWWESAKDYVKKRNKLIMNKYSRVPEK